MESLGPKLAEQRVKRDVAMAQAGIPLGAAMGYGGCDGCGRSYDLGGRSTAMWRCLNNFELMPLTPQVSPTTTSALADTYPQC